MIYVLIQIAFTRPGPRLRISTRTGDDRGYVYTGPLGFEPVWIRKADPSGNDSHNNQGFCKSFKYIIIAQISAQVPKYSIL